MALHLTQAEHDANPPSTWEVVKVTPRLWHLRQRGAEHPIESFTTKGAAEAARESGHLVDLYRKEGEWFAGRPVPGWKPRAECKPVELPSQQPITLGHLVNMASELKSVKGENPEYDRALVELITVAAGYPVEDQPKFAFAIGIKQKVRLADLTS